MQSLEINPPNHLRINQTTSAASPSILLSQGFAPDTLAPARRRYGLGSEPMTAPPNALATGELIVRLEPGEEHVARWGVRLH